MIHISIANISHILIDMETLLLLSDRTTICSFDWYVFILPFSTLNGKSRSRTFRLTYIYVASHSKSCMHFRFEYSDSRYIKCVSSQQIYTGTSRHFVIYQCCNECFRHCYTFLFADATNMFMLDENLDTLVNLANNELSKLSVGFKANHLSMNVKNTNFILFPNNINRRIKINLKFTVFRYLKF